MADVIYETYSGGLPSQFRALLSNGSGSGFSGDTLWGARKSSYDYLSTQYFQMADLNGNGLPDLIYIDSNHYIHVLANTGSGFQPDNATGTGFKASRGTGSWFKMADVTGDGIPDLVYDNGAEFCVIPGNGNGGFTTGFSAARSAAYHSGSDFLVADVNGDGLSDIVYLDQSLRIHVLLSTGAGSKRTPSGDNLILQQRTRPHPLTRISWPILTATGLPTSYTAVGTKIQTRVTVTVTFTCSRAGGA